MQTGHKFHFSEIISALSYALDLTEGQPPGHCLRSCWIGFNIGKELSLPEESLRDLYYTLLLKDAGCSSNAARLFQLYGSDDLTLKHNFKLVDSQKFAEVAKFIFKNTGLETSMLEKYQKLARMVLEGEKLANEVIKTRCYRGAAIARQFGLSSDVSNSIRYLDEHYNGKGRPAGLKGEKIPLYARVALLSQVVDVFFAVGGPQAAIAEADSRSGTWFDPQIVRCFNHVAKNPAFWETLRQEQLEGLIVTLEPQAAVYYVSDDQLDIVAQAFADIIDTKSPFTYGHSSRVTQYTDQIAQQLGISPDRRRWLRRGALLHDIGKLGVSNSILDKPGKLTEEEFAKIKLHPKYTEDILSRISIFEELAQVAGAHHERLDGKGYHKGLKEADICLETRILTVADIYDALSAERPYRAAMPVEKALSILQEDCGRAVDESCLNALKKIINP